MPPTLASVAALPQLGLRSLTGPIPDKTVMWVAVSELEDPTPFLEGGELLLTTGMRLTPANAAGYVSRHETGSGPRPARVPVRRRRRGRHRRTPQTGGHRWPIGHPDLRRATAVRSG